jgi:predicted PurR-regulated permease PerM
MTSRRLEIHIPIATIVRLLLSALFVWCALTVWPEVMFVFVALIFATALTPTVQRLARRGLARGLAVLVVGITLLSVVGAFVAFVVPPLVSQIADLANDLPLMHARALAHIPPKSHVGREIVDRIFKLPSPDSSGLESPSPYKACPRSSTRTSGVSF